MKRTLFSLALLLALVAPVAGQNVELARITVNGYNGQCSGATTLALPSANSVVRQIYWSVAMPTGGGAIYLHYMNPSSVSTVLNRITPAQGTWSYARPVDGGLMWEGELVDNSYGGGTPRFTFVACGMNGYTTVATFVAYGTP